MLISRKVFWGASVIAIGVFITKIIGAVYKIPLANVLGGNGLGLYQLIFPLYAILLDLSSAGIPTALSKLIAQEKDKSKFYLYSSLRLFSIVGIIGSILMLVLSYPVAVVQGDIRAFWGYILISPSIFFVCIIGCFRGYYQGLSNFVPTSISQIIEQLFKVLFGIIFLYIFKNNILLAFCFSIFSVSISEFIACLFLRFLFKKNSQSLSNEKLKFGYKKIINFFIPVSMANLAIPLMSFIESLIIVNILGCYTNNATALFGLYSGVGLTIINFPVSILSGIALSSVPQISSEKDLIKSKKRADGLICLTALCSSICALIVFFFSNYAVNILFSRLSFEEKDISIKLIKIMSINIVFLSLLQTENSILVGKGRQFFPIFSIVIGIVVKLMIEIAMLYNQSINIFGAGYSSIACYFSASLLNLIVLMKEDSYANKTAFIGQMQN